MVVINTNRYAKTNDRNDIKYGRNVGSIQHAKGPVNKASKIIKELESHQERVEGKMRKSRT
jgi:hypothetical protein